MGRGWLASSCGQMTGRKSAFLRGDVREIKLEQSNTPPYLDDAFLLLIRRVREVAVQRAQLTPALLGQALAGGRHLLIMNGEMSL